jgi:hypothetical protein
MKALTTTLENLEACSTQPGRYYLTETGRKSSFSEMVSNLTGKKIAEILSTESYTGIRFEDGGVFRFHGDKVVFGEEDAEVLSFCVPNCREDVSCSDTTFEKIQAVAIGQCLRNVVDYGHCVEFAITGDINLGFHKEFLYAVSTKMGR